MQLAALQHDAGMCRAGRGLKRLYADSSQEPSAEAALESSEDAEFIDPFGSRTMSDRPTAGASIRYAYSCCLLKLQ